MKPRDLVRRQHDSLVIPEGFFQEPYTPASGRITSPSLNKRLQYCKFALSEDANVTWKDSYGNEITEFPLSKGPQPFIVSEISAVSAGSVIIIHDGLEYITDRSMTAPTPES